jgi:probable rRNA maturation factor
VITVEIANLQSHVRVRRRRLREAVEMVLEGKSPARARISLAVVDDPTIRRLHREYLGEDRPTDVLSFLLERDEDGLEGEVVVSGQTAAMAAARFGWPAEDELLLYVIHGTLHLVGYHDSTPEEQAQMRSQEQVCLSRFGIEARYEESATLPRGVARGSKKVP